MSTESPISSVSNSDALRAVLLQDSPAFAAAWEESNPKRAAAMMLARLRKFANLTQKDIVDRTGWDKAYVAHLESAEGSVPDPQIIARYAEACGAVVGMVVGAPGENFLHVIDSITVRSGQQPILPGDGVIFEQLRDRDIALDDVTRASRPNR
jgi:transcriptional regulator with XRE-family HTH domain